MQPVPDLPDEIYAITPDENERVAPSLLTLQTASIPRPLIMKKLKSGKPDSNTFGILAYQI